MNTSAKRKHVEHVIEWNDVEKVWAHLERVFTLDVEFYRNAFLKYQKLHGESEQPMSFNTFGKEVIGPILNKMLQRDYDYPTWDNLICFLLKEKLAETTEQRKYYRSGEWKKMELHSSITMIV